MPRTIKIGQVGDVAPGQGQMIEVEGHAIALFNVGGTFYAVDNDCTHVGGPLAEGQLEGTTVTCPWHGATFNVTTGERTGPPARANVRSYPTKVEVDDVLIELD